MEKDKIWYLKQFNLFESIKADEMESIGQMITDNQIKKKQNKHFKVKDNSDDKDINGRVTMKV